MRNRVTNIQRVINYKYDDPHCVVIHEGICMPRFLNSKFSK